MLKYAIITDSGDRDVNEDSVGFAQKDNVMCFVLCDGLGGHGMGDVASEYVKDIFLASFQESPNKKDFFEKAFITAQESLMKKQKELSATNKMKTTLVCMVSDNKNVQVGYIGDSRFYAFSKDQVKVQTKDHSIPQMLVFTKEIDESQIRNHPDRNMLLRVMGIPWDKPMHERLKPIPLKKCQAFLLCSDGFWELIEETEMCLLLKESATVDEWLFKMTEVVKKNGSDKNMDNFSAIAIWNE